MDSVQVDDVAAEPLRPAGEPAGHQNAAFLVELSPDWVIRRVSSNTDMLLGRPARELVDLPLGNVIPTQALHDLRNLFARASASTGIARAFGIRLIEAHGPVDIAFQLHDGCGLLEAISSGPMFGVAFGSVGGLVTGLADASGPALRDGAARRMRALSGYDRVILLVDGERWENGRGTEAIETVELPADCPPIIVDTEVAPAALLPDSEPSGAASTALLRAPGEVTLDYLRQAGIRSLLRVPFERGEFICECSRPMEPSFELHAAAELFALMFAMRLEKDRDS
jgi:light-regulated signal transduction histidine kinase (bacteriophytochrome)